MKIFRVVFIMSLLAAVALLASCAAPTPEVIEVIVTQEVEKEVIVTQEVEVEKEVIVTQEVEVEKEVLVDVQGAIPYPEGVPMVGGELPKTFPLDEMIVYKALDSYSQPEWMDALVAWNERIAQFPPTDKPLLIIQGDQDSIVDWDYNLEFLQEKFPNAAVAMVPGGKHQLFGEQVKVRQQVYQFIDGELNSENTIPAENKDTAPTGGS